MFLFFTQYFNTFPNNGNPPEIPETLDILLNLAALHADRKHEEKQK